MRDFFFVEATLTGLAYVVQVMMSRSLFGLLEKSLRFLTGPTFNQIFGKRENIVYILLAKKRNGMMLIVVLPYRLFVAVSQKVLILSSTCLSPGIYCRIITGVILYS